MNRKQARLSALQYHIERLRRRLAILDKRSDRYSWVRLALFLAGFALSVLLFFLLRWWAGLLCLALTLIVFNIVAYYHRQIDRSIARHKTLLHIKMTQVARITLDWSAIPPVEAGGTRPEHPFETDLDITGERSLHQLLNSAVSREGSQRLRTWLLTTTPDLASMRQRQALIQELAPMNLFRDKLLLVSILSSRSLAAQWEGRKLITWLDEHTTRSLLPTLLIASAIALLTPVLLLLSQFAGFPQYWMLSLVLAAGFFFVRRKDTKELFEDAYELQMTFGQLSRILEYLEKYPYGTHQHVKKLCEPFFQDREHSPSRLLKHVERLVIAASLGKNPLLLLIINVLVPWDFYIAHRLNYYKAQIATRLPVWLDVWFELEALTSLAGFAYLNPEYVLPTVMAAEEQTEQPLFRACELGHPLIPESQKVSNDFTFQHVGEVMIITGSNMAGKSTFLRTLGINLCLVYAGGPVCASAFQCALFRIFTCIKVSDSVTGGYSYFYAEVKRLKALLDELKQGAGFPLFFLIDEIFKGTNNRERLIGSRSYLRALVGQNCVGAVSTHDLELVRLADTLPAITNYHFREEVIDGQMVFDYILRPGPCPTTNALKIMRLEGLPVEVEQSLI
ncbi:MAG: hypothetical protein ABI456_23725 [Ktedonobacteraceae bacterium]